MRAAALLFAFAWVAPASALANDSGNIVLQERVPFAFILATPTGEIARASSSEIIRVVGDVLRDHTDFALQLLDPMLMTECRGRLGCLSLKVRRDYEREDLLRPDGAVIPFAEHRRRVRVEGTPHSRYLLVISNVTIEGEADRMTAVLVDTDLALQIFHEASRSSPDWADEVETRIDTGAVVTEPIRAHVRDFYEARDFIERVFAKDFRKNLEATEHWHPYGSISLTTPVAGAVTIDGQTVGTSRAGTLLIEKVRPGARTLEVTHPDHERFAAKLDVRRGQETPVNAEMARTATDIPAVARQITLWTGVATAIAGGVITGLAVSRQDSAVGIACFEGPGAECQGGTRFSTLGYDPTRLEDPNAINPAGIRMAPLGYSVAGAGLAWALGAFLTPSDDLPWIAWVAGAAVGAIAFGTSAALDAR